MFLEPTYFPLKGDIHLSNENTLICERPKRVSDATIHIRQIVDQGTCHQFNNVSRQVYLEVLNLRLFSHLEIVVLTSIPVKNPKIASRQRNFYI